MKRIALCIGMVGIGMAFGASAKPVMAIKGGDEFDRIKNTTLVVVLLEENPKYEQKLTKMHKIPLLNAYKNNIKTINDNLQAMVPKYLTMAKDIEYKTMTDIVDLPEATREQYSFLVYDRSPQFSNGGAANFEFDFYIDKSDERHAMLSDYLDFIQFDAADPRYHGEDDYRRMEIIVEGKKKTNEQLLMQGLDMIIPTQGSFALCFAALQKQFDDAFATPQKMSKEEMKTDIRDKVAKARTKTLLICQDNLDRNITAAKIGTGFKYPFKVVPRADFDKAILDKDESSCLLVVYPADKTATGYRPAAIYQHLIIDAATDEVLLIVAPPVSPNGMPVSYQKLNDKSFKDIVKEEDDITK